METGYCFDITRDGEIIFTKEKEEQGTPQQQLIEQISKTLNMNYEEAEFYTRNWHVACLKEYMRGGANGIQRVPNATCR